MKTLNFKLQETALAEAIERMKMLNFTEDTIEKFKQEGRPSFCMENGRPCPLRDMDEEQIDDLINANFTVYAAIRYFQKDLGYSTAYLFVDNKGSQALERTALAMDMPMAFIIYDNDYNNPFICEVNPVRIRRLPGGMLERVSVSPEELASASAKIRSARYL